jgi:NAD(P)-dependent dehydrogenase (short-subunit alcohol dehydrogenase family)
MSTPLNILITGASSGFGLLFARTLASKGHNIFATMRDPEGRNAGPAQELTDFGANTPGNISVLELDVADEATVQAAVKRALNDAGSLDVVINNAGIGAGGHAEAFTAEQMAHLFDINVGGVQRVCRAVLPAMRAAGRGLVINISTIMGRIVLPFSGPYTASKYALEGLSESYRYELMGSGVDMVLVEPGGFPTGIGSRMMPPDDSEQDRIASYGAMADMPQKMWGDFMEMLHSGKGPDPQIVADEVLALIETPAGKRPLRVVVDPFMGGEAPKAINEMTDGIQAQLLQNLGMAAESTARA